MSKNHGQLTGPSPTAQPGEVIIPLFFQRKSIVYNLPRKKAIEAYGIWELECLVAFDTTEGNKTVRINVGDKFSVPGDEALDLALFRTAKFSDKRAIEEAELRERMSKLGAPPAVRDMPAFQPQPQRKGAGASYMAETFKP